MSIKARIESLGAFLPERVVSMQERMSGMDGPPPFDAYAITGIETIRVSSSDDDSLSAALAAARDCLSRSAYSAQDLEIIISCSITRFIDGQERRMTFDPPLALWMKDQLGAHQAIHFDVSNACAGMFSGVYILERMIRAGTVKNGLVISGEHITCIADTAVKEITDAYDPQLGSVTVGDSGAAVLLDNLSTADDCIDYYEIMTCSEYSELCIGMPSDKTPGVALYTNNAEMHKKDRVKLWPTYQNDYYAKHGGSVAEEKFDHVIHHQIGVRGINNFNKYGSEFLGAELPPPLNVVHQYGNTATTSHFVVLYQSLKDKTLKKGEKVLLIPAASGVITGFMSLKMSSVEV
jgi:3-oxoacyl-[acyl-carrier-protein] synthase III